MKLSSRKQLLSEAEQELKEIKTSINEEFKANVSQREVEKAYYWLQDAIGIVIEPKYQDKYWGATNEFFDYLEIEKADPKTAKSWTKDAKNSIIPMVIVTAKVKETLAKLKKMEADMPEILRIIKAVEKDLKNAQ